MSFQSSVLLVANVILIISLCVIGLMLYRQKYNAEYPPIIGDCPDYWETNANMCKADTKILTAGLSDACKGPKDFTGPNYSGNKGKCEKQKWARSCNLSWDGISNVEDLCGS